MGNILNHNRPIFKLRTSKSDYWDMHLYESQAGVLVKDGLQEDCLTAYIDTTKDECIEENELVSVYDYVWDEAVNNGVELNNIGLTGVDNGFITYDKDTITEDEFKDLFTNSKLVIDADDYRLHLNKISGNNKIYRYDNEIVNEDNMRVAKLNGGFYQGFFKTGNGCNYNVLPNGLENGICLEFTLKPEHNELNENDDILPTLNDIYPENNGIFFYAGTRAENKWWKYYTNVDEKTDIETSNNISLDAQVNLISTDNKFITYNRSKNGYRANMGHFDDPEIIEMPKNYSDENYFIIMNRTKKGYTARTIKELQEQENTKYNVVEDLYNNALAFQIKENGSIGYKYLIKDCDAVNKYGIETEWSLPEMVKYNEWNVINVRLIPVVKYALTDYGYLKANDYMRILIYVNGKLVLYSKELETINFKTLNDVYEKQEGVPFNISLGGGTQGLCDVVYENYKDTPSYQLYLEKEFGGSFIGYLKSFKFYACDQNFVNITENYKYEKSLIKI